MICIANDKRYIKRQRLQALIKDIEEGRETYNGTKLVDIVEAQHYISNAEPGEVTDGDKIHYLDLLYDYCIGKMIEYKGNLEEQEIYYWIIEECLDVVDDEVN